MSIGFGNSINKSSTPKFTNFVSFVESVPKLPFGRTPENDRDSFKDFQSLDISNVTKTKKMTSPAKKMSLKISEFYLLTLFLASMVLFASSSPIEGNISFNSTSSGDDCVFIEKCEPLAWLLNKTKIIQNDTPSDINDILK